MHPATSLTGHGRGRELMLERFTFERTLADLDRIIRGRPAPHGRGGSAAVR